MGQAVGSVSYTITQGKVSGRMGWFDRTVYIPRSVHQRLEQIARELSDFERVDIDADGLATRVLMAFCRKHVEQSNKEIVRLIKRPQRRDVFYDEDYAPQNEDWFLENAHTLRRRTRAVPQLPAPRFLYESEGEDE